MPPRRSLTEDLIRSISDVAFAYERRLSEREGQGRGGIASLDSNHRDSHDRYRDYDDYAHGDRGRSRRSHHDDDRPPLPPPPPPPPPIDTLSRQDEPIFDRSLVRRHTEPEFDHHSRRDAYSRRREEDAPTRRNSQGRRKIVIAIDSRLHGLQETMDEVIHFLKEYRDVLKRTGAYQHVVDLLPGAILDMQTRGESSFIKIGTTSIELRWRNKERRR